MARRLVREGLRVVGVSRSPETVEPLEGVTWLKADLADPAQVEVITAQGEGLFGAVDVLVNNAGFGDFGELGDLPPERVRAHFQALLETPVRLTQAVLPGMLARGSGAIVNVASVAVDLPIPFLDLYNAGKAGLAGFSRSLELTVAARGVQVVDFRPADYRTGFYDHSEVHSTAEEGELAIAWKRMRANMERAPVPEQAAEDLWRALRRGRSGTVRSGSWFQAALAPWAARHLPAGWMLRRIRRYYGLKGG